MNKSTDPRTADDALAKLLKLAGPRREPSASVRAEVYAEVHQQWLDRNSSTYKISRLVQVAVAAAFVAAVALMLWLLPAERTAPEFAGAAGILDRGSALVETDSRWDDLESGATLQGGQRIRTVSTRAGLVTQGGISVRLDVGTELQFTSPQRIALNHGRIYVDTADKLSRNTIIEIVTADGVIRDIGTQFEVRADGKQTRVRVRDGEVSFVTSAHDARAGRGESLLAAADGSISRDAVTSTGASWDWVMEVAPGFETDGRRITELVEWVARETGREVRYADARVRNSAAAARISGSVSGLLPEDTLELVMATTRFTYRLDEQVVLIDKQ